jgi:hypothetical protein
MNAFFPSATANHLCAPFPHPVPHPIRQQQAEEGAVVDRRPQRGLALPEEMDDAGGGGRVGEAVEALPVAAAQGANGGIGTGGGEGEHEEEGEGAGDEEAAGGEVLADDLHVPEDIDAEVVEGVEGAVEEGEEAEHAAEPDEGVEGGEAAERGDGEAEEEEAEGPVAGEAGDGFDAVDAEGIGVPAPGKVGQGEEAEEEDEEFGEGVGQEALHDWRNLSLPSHYSPPIRRGKWRPLSWNERCTGRLALER